MLTLEQIRMRCREDGDCWIWITKDKGQDGPRSYKKGKRFYIRPLIYQHKHGKAHPADKRLTTSCGNRLCLAPDHVEARTPSWLNSRMMSSGVAQNPAYRAKMSAAKKKKVDDAGVADIRASLLPAQDLAERYGITAAYVNMLRAGVHRRNYSSPFAGLGA